MVGQHGHIATAADMVAALAMIAFIAARSVEFARALHAHSAGVIALDRLNAALTRRTAVTSLD
ncbi:MAG: hypothetical protein HC788_13230 [Sphingopyxis sp.]|nr:hypothetical protein [Sphingopyxis sp.]